MPVSLNNYQVLRLEAKKLIGDWFDRAWAKRTCADEESFEPFIFCWIAFNAWGCCVTDEERDLKIICALKASSDLGDRFHRATGDPDHPLARAAPAFQRLWPIFKVQEFRHKGIGETTTYANRAERVQDYIYQGATSYEPKVAGDPIPLGDDIPLTWANTLPAIYRVRCNLFHGEKSIRDEQDQIIVGAAFRVLVHAFHNFL